MDCDIIFFSSSSSFPKSKKGCFPENFLLFVVIRQAKISKEQFPRNFFLFLKAEKEIVTRGRKKKKNFVIH